MPGWRATTHSGKRVATHLVLQSVLLRLVALLRERVLDSLVQFVRHNLKTVPTASLELQTPCFVGRSASSRSSTVFLSQRTTQSPHGENTITTHQLVLPGGKDEASGLHDVELLVVGVHHARELHD